MSSSRKKKHTPSNLAPPNGVDSQSQAGQQLEIPTKSQSSQSHSQSPQQTQQSQSVRPWSAHTPSFEQPSSLFPRRVHTLSTSTGDSGELILFGGIRHNRIRNDLYVISTPDFSTTLLQTSGDVPEPRFGHCAVLTNATLLIWGGITNLSNRWQNEGNQSDDDSFYLLNLVSREWSRVVANGPGPGGRYYHTMTLVGSKLFVFGGRTAERRFNDIWALDLNSLKSNLSWESYESTPGNEKPLPRAGHVSVTIGDHIIIFGGRGDPHDFNDAWSFNISTRKWTELQCTGSIPCPRAGHAAVLINDVMYVFGGRTGDGTYLGDLTVFNLLTQRWTAFKDIGPSPCERRVHTMASASDGRRVFLLGGELSRDVQVDESKLIHVLDTKLLIYTKPDSNTIKHSEKTTDAGAAHGALPFQRATSQDTDLSASPQITRERNPSLPSRPAGARGRPRHVPGGDNNVEGSTEPHAKFVAPDGPSGKETARSEDGRLIELERQLSETLVAKAERDRRIAQLADDLAQKTEQAAEEMKRARLELREMQTKLDESLLSRDHALKQAQRALQKASFAAEANEQSRRELSEIRAELGASKSELAAFRLRLADTENGCGTSKAKANTYRTQTATGLDNADEDRVVHRLLERMQAMEAEIASLRLNEKSFDMMECRNEG